MIFELVAIPPCPPLFFGPNRDEISRNPWFPSVIGAAPLGISVQTPGDDPAVLVRVAREALSEESIKDLCSFAADFPEEKVVKIT